MKRHLTLIFIISAALILSGVSSVSAARTPLAFLYQVDGKIEYSKNGTKWKKVRRNKFLFEGYMVRVQDGSVMIMDKRTNQSNKMTASTQVKVTADGIQVLNGSLGGSSSSSLLAGLEQRFQKSQKYTTVRRSHKKNNGLKLNTTAKISLTDQYPDIVWQNLGPEYSYRVHVDDQVINVAATEEDVVRVKVPVKEQKESEYFVEVMHEGETVYTPERKGTINWIQGAEKEKFLEGLANIEKIDSEGFLKANYLKDNQVYVAAMDSYEQFFSIDPEDTDINSMRPVLIEVYKRLRLEDLQTEEYNLYNEILLEEE